MRPKGQMSIMRATGRHLVSAVLAGALSAWAHPAAAELKVVVTIKPLHALVAQVMAKAGQPALLVPGGSLGSHLYAEAFRCLQAE